MQSERGAAHVNIFFPLILLVLLIGAAGFAYIQFTENEELRSQISDANSRRNSAVYQTQMYEDYVKDVTKVIGEAGKYEGRDGADYGDATPLAGVTLPRNLETQLRAFAQNAEIPESSLDSFSALLSQINDRLNTAKTSVDTAKAESASYQKDRDTARGETAKVTSSRKQEVDRLTAEKTEQRETSDSQLNAKDQTIANLQRQLTTRRQEIEQMRDQHAEQLSVVVREKNLLKGKVDAMQNKIALINPPEEADGKILSASSAASKAWIDIGRREMLPRGTKFEVTDPSGQNVKAHAIVTKVDYDRAEVRLTGLVDEYDPVVKGDQIRNALYSPGVRRDIYLLGRFSYPNSKGNVKMVLENLGNRVHDKIGPGVDLVIIGGDTVNDDSSGFTPVTQLPEYGEAMRLGIEIAPLHKVREFLKLEGSSN